MPKYFPFSITIALQCCNEDSTHILTDQDIKTYTDFLDKKKVVKEYTVIEHYGEPSAHIHSAILITANRLQRPENIKQQLINRYSKYIKFKIHRGYNPAVKVRHHPPEMLHILAGGYFQKEKTRKIIRRKGFTDKELIEGGTSYEKSQKNKTRKRWVDVHNRNFLNKVDDYLFMNDIKYRKMSYEEFCKQVIIPMTKNNYKFGIAIKQMRHYILQIIEDNKDATQQFLDDLLQVDVKTIDRQIYQQIRIIESDQLD